MTRFKTSVEDREKMIELYKAGEFITTIAKQYNITAQTVWHHLKFNKVEIRPFSHSTQKYVIDENYFDVIDTEAKAYFLGLLYGDGSNDPGYKRNRVTITMVESDGDDILEKFRKELNFSKPLKLDYGNKADGSKGSRCKSLVIYNKHMSYKLSDIGMIKNKTNVMVLPNLSKDLMRHFIRGFFDADGHVSMRSFKCIKATMHSNSELFIKGIALTLIEEISDISFHVREKINPKKINYSIDIGKAVNVIKFMEWLYKDANFYLERKKNVFDIYKAG